jgi:trimethylamine--corrinoid protein Co-methyltransferase
MDMRTAQMSHGSIETGLLNIATAQIARYYKLPSRGSAGSADSKVLDMEAGYESSLNALLATLGGVNYVQEGVGGLDLTLSVSYEKFYIDNEVLTNIARASRGIEVSDDTLALETIRKVGSGGHFLGQKHTLNHMKKEHLFPELADRKKYENWVKDGGKDIQERAKEKVRQVLKEHEPEPLDRSVDKTIKNIVREIEKRESK